MSLSLVMEDPALSTGRVCRFGVPPFASYRQTWPVELEVVVEWWMVVVAVVVATVLHRIGGWGDG